MEALPQPRKTRTANHRVLLVEDELATRDRLVRVLSADATIDLVDAVADVASANAVLDTRTVDTLLTDLDLPDGNGISLIERASRTPGIRSLVITVFGDERHVIEAIRAGAAGYLLKDGTPADVARAVKDLEAGGSPISPSIARYLLKHFSPPAPPTEVEEPAVRHEGDGDDGPRLTPREHEVLRLIAKGFSYGEIAELLSLSIHTVTTHVKNTYRKLSVNSRGEAVYEAIQLGLIGLDRVR